jgi:hypothetical protein
MAVSQWKLCRMEVGEVNLFKDADGGKNQIPLLDRFWQAECRLERSYARAQRELQRLQASRPQPEEPAPAEVGQAVSPAESTAAPAAPLPHVEPPTEIHQATAAPSAAASPSVEQPSEIRNPTSEIHS